MKLLNRNWMIFLCLGVFCTGCANWQGKQDDSFTLVMLPDTQCYADTRLKESAQRLRSGDLRNYFFRQMEWIKQNKKELNIVMVAHVGDIVQTDYEEEWEIADKAFRTIDGTVPYILCIGNHDMGYEGISVKPAKYKTAVTRETQMNKYFPPSRISGKPWYGEHFGGGSENYYCLFEEAGMKFLIISLEFVPRDEVLTWANEVVVGHLNHRCIIITHWYLDEHGRRFSRNTYSVEGNTGEQIWENFVSQHENIFMVLCGHVLGESLRESKGIKGNTVFEILADYQGWNNGGDGYLRIMKFIPDKNIIEVRTYSPILNKYVNTDKSEFNLDYPMRVGCHQNNINH